MKQVITNYTFSTSGKTITLSDFGSSHPIDLKRLYLITDVTTNKILYNFADNTVASATVSSNNVITLSALQGGESNGDSLQVIYDVGVGDPTYEIPQTVLTDGTNTANVLVPGTANSSGNAVLVSATSQSATFSVSSVSTGTAYDVGNFRYVSVQVTSQYVGTTPTITFQISNDNSSWFSSSLVTASGNGGAQTTTTTTGIYYGPLTARYFRLNFTGTYSSGTATGTVVFSSLPAAQHTGNFSATQSGTWTVGSNSATGSAVPANALLAGMTDGTNLQPLHTLGTADGVSGSTAILATSLFPYNGTSYDRLRSANGAVGTTGTGLLGTGVLGYDGTDWRALSTSSSGVLAVSNAPSTSGGLSAATGSIGATATSIKASAGQVYGYTFYNNNSTIAYVQFFNTVVGSVTVGTTAPVYSIGLPANSGANVSMQQGVAHSAAIVIAITTTRAGNTSPGNTVDYNIFYT